MKEKSCGAVVINNGQVLLIQSHEGIYGFPKGHMEKGESEKQTAIREVKEETNIDIIIDTDDKYTMSYLVKGIVPKDVVYFIGRPINKINPKPQESETQKVLWVDIDEVENILEFDNIKKLWKQIMKNMI